MPHPRLPIASLATPAELGIERLEELRSDPADRLVPECRIEVDAGVALVTLPPPVLDLVHPQPRRHGSAEARLRLRVPLLVDLRPQPLEERPRVCLVLRRAAEPDVLAGQRVNAGGSMPAKTSTWNELPRWRMCPRGRPVLILLPTPRRVAVTTPVTAALLETIR
jgi:hypothetical protein